MTNVLPNAIPVTKKVSGYFKAARPPFHTVGVFPFILGTVLASSLGSNLNLIVSILGCLAVILIMLSTYYNGEFYDMTEDKITYENAKSNFAGGSHAMFEGKVQHKTVRNLGYISILLAILIGLSLQFIFNTGIWTIPLGVTGIVFGFFYSIPPFRWVRTGFGELMIGYAYGWLPVTVGFYINTGNFIDIINWISLPIAFTIFNVILINEFPDYPADCKTDKKNLTVRFGKIKASYIYITVTLLSVFSFLYSLTKGINFTTFYFYLPILIISLILILLVALKKYEDRKILEAICGLTIVTNLGTTIIYIISIMLYGIK